MILYPTETVYGLGVNALNARELSVLYALKGRDAQKAVSWLVRNVNDINQYAIVSPLARTFAEQFLPGPLTLVLPVNDDVPKELVATDGTVGFRVSSDLYAQALIEAYMSEMNAPLTCTSANISGLDTLPTPVEIEEQFRAHNLDFKGFDRVIDGGVRTGRTSTVVRVTDGDYEIIREGMIPREAIMTLANNF